MLSVAVCCTYFCFSTLVHKCSTLEIWEIFSFKNSAFTNLARPRYGNRISIGPNTNGILAFKFLFKMFI